MYHEEWWLEQLIVAVVFVLVVGGADVSLDLKIDDEIESMML